jgi:CMP-N,N'-diacetyllegionaminic acid synthase
MKILGIIPARGGSKGVPGKNIKDFNGRPLIAWTIKQASKSAHLTTVIVSTDSGEIADAAKKHGGVVPFLRPAEFAQDHTPTIDVVLHALQYFKTQGKEFDAVCLLQCTSPYRPNGAIDDAIEYYIRMKADSLVSVRRVPDHYNPHWTFEPDGRGFLQIATGEDVIIPRRQDLPVTFTRDGAIYITDVKVLQKKKSFIGTRLAGYPISSPILFNIDTAEDWQLAEHCFDIDF